MNPIPRERLFLAAGLVLGLLSGLGYSWLVNPVSYYHTNPACLPDPLRQQYVELIASAYATTGDLDRARTRLQQLELHDMDSILIEAVESMNASTAPHAQQGLQQLSTAIQASAVPEASPTDAPKNSSAPTAVPSASPTFPAAPGDLALVEIQKLCSPDTPPALLEVHVLDQAGEGIPSIQLEIHWQGGCSCMVTGLKPDHGPGYADFVMQEEIEYSVQAEGLSENVGPLELPACFNDLGQRYPGSWVLKLARDTSQDP